MPVDAVPPLLSPPVDPELAPTLEVGASSLLAEPVASEELAPAVLVGSVAAPDESAQDTRDTAGTMKRRVARTAGRYHARPGLANPRAARRLVADHARGRSEARLPSVYFGITALTSPPPVMSEYV